MTTEDEYRQRVLTEALSWEHTPYVPRGRVKGANGGCDCLTFVAGVFIKTGQVPADFPIPHYAHDFHLNSDVEYYLLGKDGTPGMLQFCREIEGPPKPADIVLWKFGFSFSHAAIVIEWPRIIHAWNRRPVGPDNALQKDILMKYREVLPLRGQPRPRRYFTVKDWGI